MTKGNASVVSANEISVVEYALAMDGIADAYLTNSTPMPANLLQIFEKLAVTMHLASDPD